MRPKRCACIAASTVRAVAEKLWIFIFVGAAVLSGCHRSPTPPPPRASAPFRAPVPLSQVDLGASLLAEVENARVAIGVRNPVAASNDVAQVLSFANQLPDRPSKLMRSEPASSKRDRTSRSNGTSLSHAPLSDFGAQVELNSAQVDLIGNFAAADADLRNVQNGIPQGLIPRDLPLLRAAASLELARFDASAGQIANLRTQLLSAQYALRSYTGPGHVEEAQALAATIEQALRKHALNTMLPYQPSAWLTQVVEWAGTDRWNAPIR